MSERSPERTRARILATALELFATRGYADTSIRLIGKELGMTSATLYYHFASKDDILESLCRPLFEQLRQQLEDGRSSPQDVLGWMLDHILDNRALATVFFDDPSFRAHSVVGPRVAEIADLLVRTLAGPDPTVRQLVRAYQAVAACKSAVHLPPDLPRDQIRREVMAGACELLGLPATN